MRFPLTTMALVCWVLTATAAALDLPSDEVAGIIRPRIVLRQAECASGTCAVAKAPSVAPNACKGQLSTVGP